MSEPLVSIIMGAYNCANVIGRCIDSIIAQTYENWELIVCDDCSTDGTNYVIKCYAERDNRITLIKNKVNSRLAASLNNCLSIAKGKYIARVDADDMCMPNRIARQVRFLEAHDEYDCVGSDRIVFDETGDKGIRKSIEFPDKWLLKRGAPFAHPTIMMKKKVFDELNGYVSSPDTIRAEDLDLWFRFYEKGYRGYNIQEALYKYRESEFDFTKRSLKAAIGTTRVFINGYKLLGFPFYVYIYAFKPIVGALLPNALMHRYHQIKDRNVSNAP